MKNKWWINFPLAIIIAVFLFSSACVNKTTKDDSATPIILDVTLAWNDVPDATSYNIYWSDKPGVNKKNGTKISNVKNPYKMTGLKKKKEYYFVVTAVNDSGESRESEEISCIVGQ